MPVQGLTPILNVSDVPASFAWFEKLGWNRGFAWNSNGIIADAADRNEHGPAHFGSVCSGKVEIFLCAGGQGSRGTREPQFPGDDSTDGVWMSWWMQNAADVDATYEAAVRHGMSAGMPPRNEPWGVREFHLRHPDGHTFRVSAGLAGSHS